MQQIAAPTRAVNSVLDVAPVPQFHNFGRYSNLKMSIERAANYTTFNE